MVAECLGFVTAGCEGVSCWAMRWAGWALSGLEAGFQAECMCLQIWELGGLNSLVVLN